MRARPYRSWSPALALLSLAVLLAACGGSSSPTPTPSITSTPPVTATAPPAGFLPTFTPGSTPGGRFVPSGIPTAMPTTSIFFDHPEGELRWDGPRDSVYSTGSAHCGGTDAHFEYGLPSELVVAPDLRLYLQHVLERQADWRWTGYYHGDWQIWQGDDPEAAYIMHASEPHVAFEYRFFHCF